MTLVFDPVEHEYHLDGRRLMPVSTWIATFTPEFPVEIVSKMVAKTEGTSQQIILDKWEMKKELAIDKGNWVHKSCEYYLKYDQEWENRPVRAFKKHETKNEYLSEVIVHDENFAGTIDLIELLGDKKVILHDYKTNEDLYKKHGKLKAPFKDLANTPINKYTLQLNKYKELLEKMKGVEVVGMNIWWWDDDKGEFEILPVEEINIK